MPDEDPTRRIAIRIHEDSVQCLIDDRESWRTPINSLLLIAEYTSNEGPWGDDYFLNFWSLENNQLLKSSITCYAHGLDEAISALSQKLSADLQFGLLHSTEWASRVMWPRELAGHPYFTFREVAPKTWREKLSYRLWGATREYFRTEEVQEYLQRHEAVQPTA